MPRFSFAVVKEAPATNYGVSEANGDRPCVAALRFSTLAIDLADHKTLDCMETTRTIDQAASLYFGLKEAPCPAGDSSKSLSSSQHTSELYRVEQYPPRPPFLDYTSLSLRFLTCYLYQSDSFPLPLMNIPERDFES